MKLLKSFLLTLLFLFSSSNLFSQQDSVCMGKDQVQLHFLPSYAISYLNSLSDNSAIRYSASLSLYVGGSNNDNDYTYNQEQRQMTETTDESNSQSLTLSAVYMGFGYKHKYGKIYYGAGPTLSLSRRNSQTDWDRKQVSNISGTDNSETRKSSSSSAGIGVAGILGVECYITESLSIIGEFQLSALYSWEKEKSELFGSQNDFDRIDNITGTSWNVNLRGFLLGIAVRF